MDILNVQVSLNSFSARLDEDKNSRDESREIATDIMAATTTETNPFNSFDSLHSFCSCFINMHLAPFRSAQKITAPFPIQRQCLPALCAGRDVIGIAKTGSGKTLAYALPMLRHILAQPDLAVGESGPIGLVLAPARELAIQINDVVKKFAKVSERSERAL